MFKGLSPGDRITLNNKNPLLTIDASAPNGVYHYAAAISVDDEVFLDSGCGDIGVQN